MLRSRNASRTNYAANYSGENCAGCALKPKFTTAAVRRGTRRSLAEPIKRMMGCHASSAGAWMPWPEMALAVTAFNLLRTMRILGVPERLAAASA